MANSGNIDMSDISAILNHFKNYTYNACDTNKDPFLAACMVKCKQLFSKDYKLVVLENKRGELCSHYPAEILIPTEPLTNVSTDLLEKQLALGDRLIDCTQLFLKARFARCRGRFIVPSILYNDKFICRAAALASSPEMYGRVGLDMLFASNAGGAGGPPPTIASSVDTGECDGDLNAASNRTNMADIDKQLVEGKRRVDIELLNQLKVRTVCDLMVENKKGMYGIYFASSEKADKERRYKDFDILVMPYSGCEFFSIYGQCAYRTEQMMCEWDKPGMDAYFTLPGNVEEMCKQLNVDWSRYKLWDVGKITENYLLILLLHLCKGEDGLLVHCISGWDRTPLFIAMIRLSLWADSKIHTSLSALEMVYLTLAYDWLLFGHQFQDRLSRAEEVLFFGYNVLNNIGHEKFSIDFLQKSSDEVETIQNEQEGQQAAESSESIRMKKLREVREIFIGAYGSAIGFHFGEGIGQRRNLLTKTFSKIVDKFDLWSTDGGSSI